MSNHILCPFLVSFMLGHDTDAQKLLGLSFNTKGLVFPICINLSDVLCLLVSL